MDYHKTLKKCAGMGDLVGVKHALAQGADINWVDVRGWTALARAAYNGRMEVVKYLVLHGADVNKFGPPNGDTPLFWAARYGYLEIVKYLLDNGANIDQTGTWGQTPLTGAALDGDLDVVKYLVESNAEVNKYENTGLTPLSAATLNGLLDIVKYLLDNGADVNQRDGKGKIPLQHATERNHSAVAEYLKKISASDKTDKIDGSDNNRRLQPKAVEIEKANINSVDRYGITPLSEAVLNGDIARTQWLLDNGALFSVPTAFLTAIDVQNLDMVRLLLSKGALINIIYRNGWTPLIKSIRSQNREIVEELLKSNCDVNLCDGNGNSPLVEAIERRDEVIIKLLIANGADVNLVDDNGNLPLNKSIETEHLTIVQELVANGANPNLPDKRGNLPLRKALNSKNQDIIEYLIDKGADIATAEQQRKTSILMTYLEEKNFEMVKRFAQRNEYLDMIGPCGFSPLTKAIQIGNVEIVRYLVDKGADVNIPDLGQCTPLSVAASKRDFLSFDYLVRAGANIEPAMNEIEKFATADENFEIYFNLLKDEQNESQEQAVEDPGQEDVF